MNAHVAFVRNLFEKELDSVKNQHDFPKLEG